MRAAYGRPRLTCAYHVIKLFSPRDVALEDMTKLKELIDANTFAPVLQQMQQRAWLMHWGLYIFFNHENGRNLIVDTLFQDRHVILLLHCSHTPSVTAASCHAYFCRPCKGLAQWLQQ